MSELSDRFARTLDLHQTQLYGDFMRLLEWEVVGQPGSQLFYRRLGPLVIAKLQRPQNFDLTQFQSFRTKYHPITTYLEPGLTSEVPKIGWSIPVEPFAHSCTSLLDLSQTESELLSSFSQKTRYNITRNLKKASLTLKSVPFNRLSTLELSDFFSLHDSWSKKKHVLGYPKKHLSSILAAFKQSGDLHFAYVGKELVGSLLILYHDKVATYYAAFASPLGYTLFAPTLLTWSAIQAASSRGCKIFDFGGIYDPRYPKMYKHWQGFTKFKSGFHPTVISYPATSLHLFW